MDVGAWSWKWRAAGGMAVTLFTPYCFLNLLQINWEARENVEAVAPSLVQWIRETYGFEDEDEDLRAHVARMDAMYAEPAAVAVLATSREGGRGGDVVWSGTVAGAASAADVRHLVSDASPAAVALLSLPGGDAQAVAFADAPRAAAAADGSPREGDEAASAVLSADPLNNLLSHARSVWVLGAEAEAAAAASEEAATALLTNEERKERALAAAIVAVRPIAPAFQRHRAPASAALASGGKAAPERGGARRWLW